MGIIDIDVLRNDRFHPAADAVRSLPLLHPDRFQKVVNVARLDFQYRELADGGIGIALERRRPLIAVLLTPV